MDKNSENRVVQIADDVIAMIAQIATLEVEGMKSIGTLKQDLVQTITGKQVVRGIAVEIGENEGEVSVSVKGIIQYGCKIKTVCKEVQEKVKSSIETMTGLRVMNVDVHIIGVSFSDQKE
ncbi:MAG: hypothetical protein BEN19_02585 [Epulopiscium sp. Nuni2H_MBin003]|nr:MAG: hypothetical protein BEN19_02585 [Epulopiscium sp. Nuni2H_MBin003]